MSHLARYSEFLKRVLEIYKKIEHYDTHELIN